MSYSNPMEEFYAGLFADSPPVVDEGPAMRAARAQAIRSRRELLARGELMTAEAFAEALAITPAALAPLVRSAKVFAVEVDGERYYPRFLADRVFRRFELQSVCQALRGLDGWDKWVFFTTPKLSLRRATPLRVLVRGGYRHVLTAAAGYRTR